MTLYHSYHIAMFVAYQQILLCQCLYLEGQSVLLTNYTQPTKLLQDPQITFHKTDQFIKQTKKKTFFKMTCKIKS